MELESEVDVMFKGSQRGDFEVSELSIYMATEQASEFMMEIESLKPEFNTVKDEKLLRTQDLEGWISDL
ncbi:hypothetical protein AgCh_027996 [Apium graveolens]